MGCKLASIDVGAPAVRMAYSPIGGHMIIAVLEVRILGVAKVISNN